MLNALLPLATPLAAETPAGADWEHPFEPIIFGFITFGIFMALLGVLWLFRNTLALPPHREGHGTAEAEHGSDGAHAGAAAGHQGTHSSTTGH